MYRKVLTASFIFVLLLLTLGYFVARNYEKKTTSTKITTSFFPLYVAAANILKDLPVELSSLYSADVGCIHESNFSTDQLVNLSDSKILIINGAGMDENILEKTSSNIKVINASESIPLIRSLDSSSSGSNSSSSTKEESDSEKNSSDQSSHHEEYNPHYWLSISDYIQVVSNIKQGLLDSDRLSAYYPQIEKNTSSYIDKLQQLKKDSLKKLSTLNGSSIYFLDDSFKYFVLDLPVNATFIPFSFHKNSYSPSDLVHVIKIIKQEKIKTIFVSEDAPEELILTFKKELNLNVHLLSLLNKPEDSSLSGIALLNFYLTEYQKNIDTLIKALNL